MNIFKIIVLATLYCVYLEYLQNRAQLIYFKLVIQQI